MLVGLIFSRGVGGNTELDVVVLVEAVGQFQNALPRSASRAWRRVCLAFSNRRNRRPGIVLGPVDAWMRVVDQGIVWVLGEVGRKRIGRA